MAHPVLRLLTTLVATSVASVAVSQELPTLADVPAYDATTLDLAPGTGAEPGAAETVPAPLDPSAVDAPYMPLQPIPMPEAEALPLAGCYAATESSGTWLRRGLWYADLDAVVMARTWNSAGTEFFAEYDAILDQATGSINAFQLNAIPKVQRGILSESSPGYDASARLALGRFLFRDQKNRDHTFDMVIFGGAETVERLGAEAQHTEDFPTDNLGLPRGLFQVLDGNIVRDQRGLHVSSGIDSSAPATIDDYFSFPSFDRADTMDVEYASRFHSWEWNYNVAQRMRKDRMELQPSGEWIRRAADGFTWDYVAGFRYFDVEERLDWYATDIASVDTTNADTDGSYNIKSSNNLFGIQLGAGLTYETDRWNVSFSFKNGFYVNDARATTALTFVDPDNDISITRNNYETDLHENGVSYLAQGGVVGRYHLRPNLSLRAGWEFMYVTGLALAPYQANFNPAYNQLHMTGDVFYHGVTAGTEYYW